LELEAQNLLEQVAKWARKRSPWIYHINASSCNGCDIELVASLTPRYDIERFGAVLVPSPRHADVLVVTGVVNAQTKDRLRRVYEQLPEPKLVIALGACATAGGVFKGCYNAGQGVQDVVPVNMFIPGCPPRPEAIMYGVLKLLGEVK
jgi:NADH-quinone oxidoreductase B subunit